MPRRSRQGCAGLVFHVFNRVVEGMTLFASPADYACFRDLLADATRRFSVPLFTFALMPTHFHLVLRSIRDRDLAEFMHWLQTTHTALWRKARGTIGRGAVYQGRYKAIPVQHDGHFLRLCLYVERNPRRKGLVDRVEDWPWSGAARPTRETTRIIELSGWPVSRPDNWEVILNEPERQRDVSIVREHIRRNRPFGDKVWQREMRERLKWRFDIAGCRVRQSQSVGNNRPLFVG